MGAVGAEQVAERYRRFAEHEARDRSPLYAQFAAAVAGDQRTLDLLARMPPAKWQPNLLFGVVRYLYGALRSPAELLDTVHANKAEIAATMAIRTTQTNEPGRCATLLPLFALLPEPLALLEVGASAGLCLLPDRYSFDYGSKRIAPRIPTGLETPVFECRASPGTPLPARNLDVCWRAGLDLDPLDLGDPAQVRWLEALVWPGEEHRIPRLRAACEIARADLPRVEAGDLRTDLRALADQAPDHATLVVYHSAVLAYVPDAGDRAAFARLVSEAGAVWIANEAPDMIPGVAEEVASERDSDDFLVCLNGAPVAWADTRGSWIEWRRGAAASPPGIRN